MPATEKKNIWLWASGYETPPPIDAKGIAAEMGIYMAGAPCYVSQSGTVKLCNTSDGSDAWHGFLLRGVAAELAITTSVRFSKIRPLDLYAVYLETSGTDIAEASAMVGDQNGLVVSTTAGQIGYVSLNSANANATVQIVGMASEYEPRKFTAAMVPGVAIVQFLNTVIQASKA